MNIYLYIYRISIIMELDFCINDNNLLFTIINEGKLMKHCKCCNSITPITSKDTLISKKKISDMLEDYTSNLMLKNIANDNINVIIKKKCLKCGAPYKKLFIKSNLTKSFELCPCLFK